MLFNKKKKIEQKKKEAELYSFLTTLCIELKYGRDVRQREIFESHAEKFHARERNALDECYKLSK